MGRFSLELFMEELAQACDTVEGIDRTFGYPAEKVEPPAVVVTWPTVTYSQTYRGPNEPGQDEYEVPVFLVLSRSGRVSQRKSDVARFIDGDFRDAINNYRYTGDPVVSVLDGEPDTVEIADTSYFAVVFTVSVET